MGAGVFVSRRSVVNLIIAVCLVAVSCSDRESPTSPLSPASAGKATISGTLLTAGDAPGDGQPLANATVRVVSTGQTAQTDAAGNFTLAGVTPGAVALEIRGAGVQTTATVSAPAAMTTKVTVTVSRGRSTVSLSPRSHDGDREGTRTPTVTGTPPTATPTRTPRPNAVEVEGTVGTISGTSFVLMTRSGNVTIQTDSSTIFRREDGTATFGDIHTGDRVEVHGTRQSDGSVLATRVDIEEDEAEERTKTPTAAATMTTTPTTPLPTGTPTPTRTPEPEEVEREGTVASITGTSFMLMTHSGSITVQTTSATRFRGDGDSATLADVHVGGEVEAEGTLQSDGSLLADRVSIQGH